MPKTKAKTKRARAPREPDVNQVAYSIVHRTTGGGAANPEPKPEKNPAAVALGKLGGLKGGRARAESLTKKERTEIARLAASARWKKG